MTKAERAQLQAMNLSPRQHEMLVELHEIGYGGKTTFKRSEWKHLDVLVRKGYAERNPTAIRPRAYRMTSAGESRLFNPIELLEDQAR